MDSGNSDTEPLVGSDVDLTKLDGFMLDTVRLLGSELVALSTGDEFKAAVMLWCRAWKQVPAASLPADDRVLASFAGNLSIAKWRKVKDMALRGFVKCADGRLYHRVLAQDALRADKAHKQRKKAIDARWEKEREAARLAAEADTESIRPYDPRMNGMHTEPIPTVSRDGTGRDGTLDANTVNTQSILERSSLPARSAEIRSFGSVIGGSGKWSEQQKRDEFAVAKCVPFLPGSDDGERWGWAMAAEDRDDPKHQEACRHMLAASKSAKVGWVSPDRRAKP